MGVLAFFHLGKCKLCYKKTCGESLCDSCREKISFAIDKRERILCVDGINVKAHYLFNHNEPVVKSLIYALKRNGDKEIFLYVSKLFETALPQNSQGKLCVFVPRKAVNVREYGYDHIKRSLKFLCKNTESDLKLFDIIKRRGFSKEQKALGARERAENAKGKFRVTKKNTNKDVLLFDDVVTTGSSASECIRKLREQGYTNIECVFLASTNR